MHGAALRTAAVGAAIAIAAIAIAVVGARATASTPPSAAVAPVDLASLVAPIRAEHDLPALAVAVVTPDGIEAIGCDGVRRRDGDAKLELGDRFHLGSCTKAMTATLAALLVADGSIRFDSTVGEVLDAAVPEMDPSWKAVTLDDLLRHEGGAPGPPDAGDWRRAWACTGTGSGAECRRAFVTSMLSRPIAQPRGKTVYSNQGYALAGFMLETAAKAEYETLLVERLFRPLGITSAGFGPPDPASGHAPDGAVSNIDNPSAVTPAGRVHMTLEDWGRFIALHLRREPIEGVPLDRAAFDRLHTAQRDMALGWIVTKRPWGGTVLTHSGSNTRWFCTAWLAPEKGFAVIAATNQGGDAATKACDEACVLAIANRVARRHARTPPADAPERAPADAPGRAPADAPERAPVPAPGSTDEAPAR